ncbi:hypothetical protein EVAR_51933_1 [Eumeta japonica]|uniref:Uncharacterized protein n=1 Tax=Eumeta variegata TaxID=151549 RepID=A0A4C1YK34_EUMVA|nr:hypothetical protein EVAR_51933_1 [Eumeta japonica]
MGPLYRLFHALACTLGSGRTRQRVMLFRVLSALKAARESHSPRIIMSALADGTGGASRPARGCARAGTPASSD